MKRRRTLKRKMPRPKKSTVSVNFRIDGDVKADLERSLTAHGRFSTNTAFWIACSEALILQVRRGEMPAYPLEFVAKSSEPEPEPEPKAKAKPKKAKVSPATPPPTSGPYPHH